MLRRTTTTTASHSNLDIFLLVDFVSFPFIFLFLRRCWRWGVLIPSVTLIAISFISIMSLSASLSQCTHHPPANLAPALLVPFLLFADLVVLVSPLPPLSPQLIPHPP